MIPVHLPMIVVHPLTKTRRSRVQKPPTISPACTQSEGSETLTTSAEGWIFSIRKGSSRHLPVQYIASGEPQRSIGDKGFPYHDSPAAVLVEMDSDRFVLVLIGVLGVIGDDKTWSMDVRFHVMALWDRRLACVTLRRGRRDTINEGLTKFKSKEMEHCLLALCRTWYQIIRVISTTQDQEGISAYS